ncbi:MAG: aldo/keto reductase [Candidatus Latescibacteria bacterium]|jgi:aryl-alcohol dehydrogenase-like predicted oxidoreductase|nr:oxidoreductase [Gemmatimonadaceae bacterium]MDP7449784.1 aldo/keto reductase [Candidatus Latescibacterota bacterium]HJP32536.1 aldo/keto reductase [Candidatus Latescibacterota bacterium]
METREYGNTGEQLSIIGFGGIMVSKVSAGEASSLVAEAVDRGVNYFDVAPTYGNAQQILGPALAPYRDDAFLACKTTERTAAGARRELEESLKWMQTDHFDLYQMHAVNTDEDFDTITGTGGALEAFLEAKEKGQARYVGFSSHSAETALRLIEAVDLDSVLFPINWSTWLGAGFGPQVVAAAQARSMGRLALKAMAYGKLEEGAAKKWSKCWYQPIEDPALADLALRFSLSQPITAALPPGEPHFYPMALDIGERFTAVTEDEIAELNRLTSESTPIFELAA